MKPLIGITPSAQTDELDHGTFRRYVLSSPYVRAVETAGGIPLILPPQPENAEALSHIIDGLILSGGADIDPLRYGESSIHPDTYGVDDERDRFELELFNAMVRQEKPIFGFVGEIKLSTWPSVVRSYRMYLPSTRALPTSDTGSISAG